MSAPGNVRANVLGETLVALDGARTRAIDRFLKHGCEHDLVTDPLLTENHEPLVADVLAAPFASPCVRDLGRQRLFRVPSILVGVPARTELALQQPAHALVQADAPEHALDAEPFCGRALRSERARTVECGKRFVVMVERVQRDCRDAAG